MKEHSKVHKLNQEAYAHLFKELIGGPCTCHELAAVSGLHVTVVQNLMLTFKRHKLAHISAWEPDSMGRDATQVYSFGPGRNVSRRKLSGAERQQRYRDRLQLKLLTVRPPANNQGASP